MSIVKCQLLNVIPMRFIYTKAFAIFAACVVGLAFLVFLQTRGWLDPIRTAFLNTPRPAVAVVNGVASPVKNFFTTIYQLNKINNENAQLRNQVILLQQQLVDENEQNLENQALRAELGFVKNTTLPLVSCGVLSENPLGQTDALVLNCGTRQGVDNGQAVISQGYLVGKIIYAGPDSSTALLITDSNFSTDARISQTNSTALVKGSFGSGLILDQVQQTSDLQKGWLVVTAGINAKIPKNILIGQVSDILSSSNDLFKRAALISPIDFDNLQFVFVVKQ
jgi:rod shape-determining protein MreC